MTKKILLFLIFAAVIIGAVFFFRWYNSPEQRFARLVKHYGQNPTFDAVKESLARNNDNLYKNPTDYESNLSFGTNLYVLQDYTAALSYYERAVAINPGNFLAHYNAGQALAQLERYIEAKDEFMKAIELDGSQYASYYELENLYFYHFKDQISEMEDVYKKAVEVYPNDQNFKVSINQFYDRIGQPQKKIQ